MLNEGVQTIYKYMFLVQRMLYYNDEAMDYWTIEIRKKILLFLEVGYNKY